MTNHRKKILIIDDEPRIRGIYVRMCVEAGLVVRWASDAREATNIIIREKIDLILLDILLPGIDGLTIYEIIQEYDPSIRIIVTSVYPLDVQREMFPQAYDYYDKSYGPTLLLDKVFSAI